MKCKILNIKDSLVIRVPLLIDNDPFFYIKLNKLSNNYRVSFNYDHLNKMYGIKFNFIRNFDKIHIKNNCLFTILNNNITLGKIDSLSSNNISELSKLYYISKEDFNVKVLDSTITNNCSITKLTFKSKVDKTDITTIFILKRLYDDTVNYSILFSSCNYYKLDDFLETIL